MNIRATVKISEQVIFATYRNIYLELNLKVIG